MDFKNFKLLPTIQQALDELNYITPTPIQEKTIPDAMKGKDVFGCAQTGTGKTAAFSLPIIHQMVQEPTVKNFRALILAPTRELAIQISENMTAYTKYTHLRLLTIYGGVSQVPQEKALRKGVDIVVATPGRLLDLMRQGNITLKQVKYFVLDEADRMLDMGFIHDVKNIIAVLPEKRQSAFFTATTSKEVLKLSEALLRNPVFVSTVVSAQPADTIKQSLYYVNKDDKRALLSHLIETENIDHAIIFMRSKWSTDKLAKYLMKSGIVAASIHGEKSQSYREKTLKDFKAKNIRVLVATDIASRGLDVDQLSHVINYDIPEVTDTYIHRIGRTGRAGYTGSAISLCSSDEKNYMNAIIKVSKEEIEIVKKHPFSSRS